MTNIQNDICNKLNVVRDNVMESSFSSSWLIYYTIKQQINEYVRNNVRTEIWVRIMIGSIKGIKYGKYIFASSR